MSRSLAAVLSAIVAALALAPAALAHGHGHDHGGPPHGHASFAPDSLRESLTRERFYFLMPDRFANGDASNDRGGLTGPREVTGFDPTRKGWYHGGDLKGMISKLDYIKGLGTTAIWLTPSFKNKPVRRRAPPSRLLHLDDGVHVSLSAAHHSSNNNSSTITTCLGRVDSLIGVHLPSWR